jgi:outer membrane receptor protein involved in Fe transport
MVRNNVFSKLIFSSLATSLVAVALLQANTVFAQGDSLALEEIIVTAQRREQSLMDVPVAIEVFSGDLIRQQGFRNLDELANFSPTVLIEARVQDQDVAIRGVGTTGNTLTHDQAVPFFLDGIHFGRQSQAKLAFLDIESLEVLKGPQPVYFGMNATAGAFNIRSKRPTDTWQGYVNMEISNNTTSNIMFGVGGPINDTWGIRLAGMREETDGYMQYVVTGDGIGGYESTGGRVMLTFAPSDNFSMMFKVDAVEIESDGDANYTCLTDGPILFGRDGALDDPGEPPGREASVWNQETGTAWATPFLPLDTKCFDTNRAVSAGGPWFDPINTIRCNSCDGGFVDMRIPVNAQVKAETGGKGINGYERLDSINTVLEARWNFDSGMSLEFIGGTSDYERDYVIDNRSGAFLTNLQNRQEDFSQWSTELRLRSAGGQKVDWEIGAFMQSTELAAISNSLVADVRQASRFNNITEDVDFSSVFANVTINFNDQWALDVGGRYQEADKDNFVQGYASSWVFDVCPETPCDVGLTLTDMAFTDTTGDGIPDGYLACEGSALDGRGRDRDQYCLIDPSTVRFFGTDAGPGPYYAYPFRESRYVPDNWSWSNAIPVGLTIKDFDVRTFSRGEGPWDENFTEEGFSPQITLRYNLGDSAMIYARYAESFKIGGFDTGQSTIPSLEELTFETEDAEQIEIGIKGTAGGGRLSYTAAIFETDFPNLQVSVLSTDPEQTSASGNAGQQVQGVEWDLHFAASENWILGFAGAFLDGEMTRFPGAGCTDSEVNAAINNISAPCELYDDDLIRTVPDNAEDAFELLAIIDRTGFDAPRTPDWKFIVSADFVMPLSGGRFELTGNMKAYMSDGYIIDVEGFEETVAYDEHGDMNLMIGIRNIDGGWAVNAFARNIFEARPTYHAEDDPFPDGTETQHLGPSSFQSYGVQLEFNFD